MQGDYASARAYHEESLVIFREIGDRLGIAGSLGNLGNVARMQGDYVSARTYHEEGLVVFREIGDRLGIAGSLINLGSVAYILGDYASMHSFSAEGLVIFQELGAHSHIAACLDAFANLAARTHRLEQATVLRGAAEALREQIGVPLQPNEREPYDRAVAELSGSLAEATFTAAWARGRAMAMEQAIDYALALSGT
jgi:tetratricopeptide (TPR) repeat protein